MKVIIAIVIFVLVLFVYLHVNFHLKTGEDLEMYEIDMPSKNRLEEICDIRQPVLFDFDSESISSSTTRSFLSAAYPAFEIKIRNIKENATNDELFVPLPLHAADKLFEQDKESIYYTENNAEFLQETGVIKTIRQHDEFLRPFMVSNCAYDILFGSAGTCTPLRYEVNYRNYFLMTKGSAQVKLTIPRSAKYLQPIYDYENFEFHSPINPWSPQAKYKPDFDKVKCLEFTLKEGKTLFIPAYWWYSIRFTENSSITCMRYRTYMNNMAITPYIGLHILQIQNIKRNVVKKIDIQGLDAKTPTPLETGDKPSASSDID